MVILLLQHLSPLVLVVVLLIKAYFRAYRSNAGYLQLNSCGYIHSQSRHNRIHGFQATSEFTYSKKLDVNDVEAVGVVSSELQLVRAWNASCNSTSITNNQFTLPNVHIGPVTFTGSCHADKKMFVNVVGSVIAKRKKFWSNNSDTWIKFDHVNNLVINGTANFNGQGSDWWQSCGGKLRPCETNPTALAFNACHGLRLNGVTSINSPRNHISINRCHGSTISNINIMAPLSPNTDGIDISNTYGLNINGGHIGTGDDCIAINGNSFNINITNLNCGPGHGISVGSLGRNNAKDVVSNINVVGPTFANTQNGVRIKTVPGGSGYASRITFSNITMTNVENPIILTQFYCPHKNCTNQPQMVQIRGVLFDGIHGTSSTPNAINIHCSPNQNSCVGITLNEINIQPFNRSFKVESTCIDTNVRINGSVFPPVACVRDQRVIEMPLDYDYSTESQLAIATS